MIIIASSICRHWSTSHRHMLQLSLQDIDTACRHISHRLRPGNPANDTAFGGLHFVATGDFAQHDPVKAKVLYHGAADPIYVPIQTSAPTKMEQSSSSARATAAPTTRVTPREVLGRQLWMQFDQCIVLKQQHRFDLSNPDGKELYDIVRQITTGKSLDGQPLTLEQVGTIADAINARAVSPQNMPSFLQLKPKALVLRHINRPPLTRTLVSHHASVNKTRALVWRARDSVAAGGKKAGKELSPQLMSMLESSSVHPDKLPAVMYFYPGIPYRFVSNEFPLLGWVNNAKCIGHSIILHEDEPDDPLTGDFRVLHYPPIAIMVSIVGRDVTGMFDAPVPANCIPVFPKHSATFVVDWSKTSMPLKVYKDKNDLATANKFSVRRTSFPVEPALTFTDFFAQGQSFKGAPHLLHLNIGKTEAYKKANILVPVSRPANLSDLKLANPLWPAGDTSERARVVKKMANALKPDRHYEAEMERLQHLHHRTWSAFHHGPHQSSTSSTIPHAPPASQPQSRQSLLPSQPQCKLPHLSNTTDHLSTPPRPPPRRLAEPPPPPAKRPKKHSHTPPAPVQLQSPARPDPIPTEPDFIITGTTQGQDEATLDRAVQLKLDVLGRAQCGFNDTEGLGDCGPLSILQSLNLQTHQLMHTQCPFSTTLQSCQAQAVQGGAELRLAICAAIRDHADLQHIASIIFPDQPWQDLAAGLGTCVALHRRRRLNQSSNGIWLNALGLRACARHLNRDILVLGGPTGDISLFPREPGPHIDDFGDVYNTDKEPCIDCTMQGFYPASAFEADTIVIRNDRSHFWCTRPLVPRGDSLPSFLQERHAAALDAHIHVRYIQSQI